MLCCCDKVHCTDHPQPLTQVDKKDHANDKYMYCSCKTDRGGDMNQCEAVGCQSGDWFHFKCVRLKEVPKEGEKWLCPACLSLDPHQMIDEKPKNTGSAKKVRGANFLIHD